MCWRLCAAAAAACALSTARADPVSTSCTILELSSRAVPNFASFRVSVLGSNLPSENITAQLFDAAGVHGDVDVQVAVEEAGSSGVKLQLELSDPSALVTGEQYGVRLLANQALACESHPKLATFYAHGPITVTEVSRPVGDTIFNAYGFDQIDLGGDGIFLASNSDVVVRFSSPVAGEWERVASGSMVAAANELRVTTTTPAVPLPDDWLVSCPDTQRPVQSGSCIPDIPAKVALSLDGGLTFSAPFDITFVYVRPVKVGFLFKTGVDDFGWSAQVNQARTEIEGIFGNAVNASTYFINIPEGDFESLQPNVGNTFATGTPVPERVTDTDGTERANRYYTGIAVMRRMCDEDFDIIVPTTFGFSKMARDMGDYIGCQLAGDGQTLSDKYTTFFFGIGTIGISDVLSRAYVKAFQTRYLAGLTAAYELKRQRAMLVEQHGEGYVVENPVCVGFIAANPGNVRGVNAFARGCREVDPECIVRLVFLGTFYNPAAERDAAAFVHNVGKCTVVIQHTDSIEPQLYFRDAGAYSIGYNYDLRTYLGDSVLTSERIFWAPMLAHSIRQLMDSQRVPSTRAAMTQLSDDLRYGLDRDGLGLATYFSPVIPQYGQAHINRRIAELAQRSDDEAYRGIFCGPDMKKSWVMKTADGTAASAVIGYCGENPNWERLEDQSVRPWNPTHFWDADGTFLSPNDAITETDCLGEAATNLGPFSSSFDPDEVYNDFLLEGIELFEPQNTPFGSIVGPRTGDGSDCSGPVGRLGDRFFVMPFEFAQCDGSQWKYTKGACNADTMKAPVVYSWLKDNITGVELSCGSVADVAGKFSTLAELPYLEDGPPCDYIPHGSSPEIVGMGFTILGVGVNAIIILLLLRYKGHKAVRATQPVMVILMGVGGILLCLSNTAFAHKPTTERCVTQVVTFNLAFDSVFAILWAKIYRVNRLFAGVKKLKRVVIKQKEMIMAAMSLIFIDGLILLVWMVVDPPTPRIVREVFVNLPAQGQGSLDVVECASESTLFSELTLVFKVFLILSACALVFGAKRVPPSFVEHRFIIFSAYNTAIFSGVVLLLTSSSEDPSTAFMIHCAGTCFGTIIVNGSLTIPRFLLAFDIWRVDTIEKTSVGASAAVTGSNTTTTVAPETSSE